MVVVTGIGARNLARLSQALMQRGIEVHPVSGDDVIAERSFLFMLAMQLKPRGVVVWDDGPPGPMSDRLLLHAIASTSAAGASPLVLVTRRGDADPFLQRLRADGVSYVVVRIPERLCDVVGLGSHLAGRTILVPRESAAELEGSIPFAQCVDGIVDALSADAQLGTIATLQCRGLEAFESLFAGFDARVEVVNSLRARMAAWLGRPLLRARSDGDFEVLSDETSQRERAA